MDSFIEQKLLEWRFILPRRLIEGKVGKCDELTFEIRSKEKGHNIPHVHVSTKVASLSISIETGEVLAQSGRINEKNITKAKNWIIQNQDFLKTNWNALADCPTKFPI